MAKNIVICSDGTGNSAVKGRGTNVFKLFESVDVNGHRFNAHLDPQVAIYDDGVGTQNFKPLKIFAGAIGFGLSRNVRQLYKELCRIYDPGDRIFLFGFSRGAFTVRTLAGLICNCGIINARAPEQASASAFEHTVREAYEAYRRRYRTALMKLVLGEPDRESGAAFRQKYCHAFETKIAFIGVWDTVDAVGLPFHIGDIINTVVYRFKFPDYKLSDRVERAYHALAIDDERGAFQPLLWDETSASRSGTQVLEQAWFAGAHSNVGGGYPKQGMSLVALDWMMQKAKSAGLRFVADDREFCRDHANVDDKLYDPRAGLGIFYRWNPRDITALCRKNAIPPALHLSVLERVAHGTEDYGPGNLPPDAAVVITPSGEHAKDATALQRAHEVEQTLKLAQLDGRPLLARVGAAVAIGRVSYYVYLLSCIAAVIAATAPPGEHPMISLWPLVTNGAELLVKLATSPMDTLIAICWRLLSSPSLLAWLAGGFVVAYLLTLYAQRRMSFVFSQFWHGQQQLLRDALKRARYASTQARRPRQRVAPARTDTLAKPGPTLSSGVDVPGT